MENIKYYFEIYKKQITMTLTIISIFLIACISFFLINHKYNADEIKEEKITSEMTEKNDNKLAKTIKVDIKGYVNNPGVYELPVDSRVIDAVNIAGGLKEEAYTRYINLSKILKDEFVIIINNTEEIEEIKKGENNKELCENTNDVCIKIEETITSNYNKTEFSIDNNKEDIEKNKNETSVNKFVNINNANKEELMSLSGIGESKALKIIEYRTENGNFKTKEEIKNVKGIGEVLYAKIEEYIKVE